MSSEPKKLSGSEIREKFIKFFAEKHNSRIVKSSSLIPDNPTVLLTTAGMLQFVPIFLGYEPAPQPPRAVTVQKCARAGGKDSDIENVGRTPRHHTFFEMLGNFSFGDYFKEEIIPWAWDFITNELKLDKSRLWITIYETDDEAFKIWNEKVGIPAERILRKGKKDNFWGPPGLTGPCGPCTEIHFDLGEQYSCGADDCSIATCECDRFVEIWNLVFMELFQDEEGNHTPLEKKNVDTGMGLERITMVCNELSSTFETDLLLPILNKVCELSGKKYKDNPKTDISLRIITDHVRCVSFMIADGLVPANEGRNYVLRMILRRALRHGKILGLELPFLYKITDTVIEKYKDAYGELEENKEKIKSVVKAEEERFKQTLDKGEKILEEVIENALKTAKTISGEDAFKLYDTFGFPLELTVEIAEEKGCKIDLEGFKKEMEAQRERAKSAHNKVSLTEELIYVSLLNKLGKTEFLGYDTIKTEGSKILEIVKEGAVAQEAFEGERVDIILDKTPFYAESGGQIGDIGIIENENIKLEVENTIKFDALFIHRAKVLKGTITKDITVNALVDEQRRKEITIHHSTAHLLQSALRKVLGDTVAQSGSQVEPNRTRFDFSFDRAMTKEEIEKVEDYINQWIGEDINRETVEMTMDEAKESGATALFDEKYGDKVRVVSMGEVSKELCGGTHVNSTGEIRLCKIISESAIASGTRRIEAVCAQEAMNYLNNYAQEFNKISQLLKTPVLETTSRVEKLLDETKNYQRKIKQLEEEIAKNKINTLTDKVEEIKGGKLLIEKLEGLTPDILKSAVENVSSKLGDSVVILASVYDDKISIIAKVSDNFIQQGIKAGDLVNEIAIMCDGRGGGRPNFAQAGAKNSTNLQQAMDKARKVLKGI